MTNKNGNSHDSFKSLTVTDEVLGEGSLKTALLGEYDYNVADVISEGFKASNGHKLLLNFGFIFLSLLQWLPFIGIFLQPQVSAGMFFMGVRSAVNKRTSANQMFFNLKLFIPILGCFLLTLLISTVGLLLVIPGVYFLIAYVFSTFVLMDKGLSVWESMEASRKAITHKWFKMFGLVLSCLIINILGFVTLIGWIWTIPATYATLGVVYRKMFGVQAKGPMMAD